MCVGAFASPPRGRGSLYRTRRLQVGGRRRAIAGLVLAPLAGIATMALVATAATAEDGYFVIPGFLTLGLGIASGATAGIGSKYARRGLLNLNAPTNNDGLYVSGWVVWAIGIGGMGLTAAALVAVEGDHRSLAMGGGGASGALMTLGSILQGISALKGNEALEESLATKDRTTFDLGVTPVLLEGGGGASLAMSF